MGRSIAKQDPRQYGLVFADEGDQLIGSPSMTVNAYKLFIWATRFFKTADKLEGREKDEFAEFAALTGLDAKAVHVVQFSQKHASECFNGNSTEAKRQAKRLVDAGILLPINNPAPNHATLYLVCPNLYTSRCVPNESGNDTHSGVYQTQNERYTSNGDKVHISSEIGTHAEPATCANVTYPYSNNNYPINSDGACLSAFEGAGQSPLKCSVCGNTSNSKPDASGIVTCDECGNYWKVAKGTNQ